MELLRLGAVGEERPYVRAADGTVHDLSSITADIDGAFLAADGVARARAALEAGDLPVADVEGLRIGAPIARPGAVVCIGMNYAAHAAESGSEPPEQPIVFFKHPNTVVGPDDEVLVPRGSTKTDWEVELAVVIGKQARYLETAEEALACIAGYAVSNDVSERAFQLDESGGQWSKGKCCETFNPLGPALVPADEVATRQPRPEVLGQRRAAAGLEHPGHGLLRGGADPRPLAVHGAQPGRPREHRHPGGRRAVRPLPVPGSRRHDGAGDPGSRPPAADPRQGLKTVPGRL